MTKSKTIRSILLTLTALLLLSCDERKQKVLERLTPAVKSVQSNLGDFSYAA